MAITLGSTARTAAIAAITSLVDGGAGAGTVDVGTSAFAVTIATFTLSDPAFTAGSAGVQNLDVTPALTATAGSTNTAAVWRMRDSNSVTVLSGNVATSESGDLTISAAAGIAALDAIDVLVNTGSTHASGRLYLLTAGDSLIATLALNTTAFGAATGSGPVTMTLGQSPAITGASTAAGTITKFQIADRNSSGVGNGVIISGTVGTSGTDIVINNNVVGLGSTITVSSMVLSLPLTESATLGTLVFAGGVAMTNGETLEIASGSITFANA
jgi:hypothetical protein